MHDICKIKNCEEVCSYDDLCSYHYLMVRGEAIKRQYQSDLDEILNLSDEALAELDQLTCDSTSISEEDINLIVRKR